MTDDTITNERYWDERYRESDRMWSGRPNDALVAEVSDLRPGSALDLGCGEGGDAIWLATQGWRVTATDIAQVALDRAAEHAGAEGVADRVEWQRHDLSTSFPAGRFDLVSAQFLYPKVGLPREEILRVAAAAVAPGGILLVESHSGLPHWESDTSPDAVLPTPAEVLDALDLVDGQWEVLRCEEHERIQTGPDGEPTVRTDNTVKLRRLPD